jgi:hypothetical protein
MKYLIPGFPIRVLCTGHALGKEPRAVPEQPEADGDDKDEEQDQEDPPGRLGKGAGRKKQGQGEGHEQAGDLYRQQVQVDCHVTSISMIGEEISTSLLNSLTI